MVNEIGQEIVDGVRKAGQYAVNVGGDPVPLMSLSPGAIAKIQSKTGLRWSAIILDPLNRIDVAAWLVEAAFEKAGALVPNLNDSETVVSLFVEIPADLPDPLPDDDQEATAEDPTSAS